MAATLISWTTTFQNSVPDGASDTVSDLDGSDQDIKEQVAARLEQGGHVLTNDPNSVVGHPGMTPDNTWDGRHVVDAGGTGISPHIYNSDGTTKLITVADDSVIIRPSATFAAPGVTAGNNPGHLHDTTAMIPLGAISAGVVPGLYYENLGEGDVTLLSAKLLAGTATVGDTCVVSMHLLASGFTDPGVDTGTEVFNAAPDRPTLASGEYNGTAIVSFNDDTLEVGECWNFYIDSNAGNADNLVLLLKIRRG